MSVVAVRVNKSNIEIASDSIIVRGDSKKTDSTFHKLEKINDIIIGAVGDAQEASLFMLYCHTHNIAEPTKKDVLAFMCEFVSWRAGLTEDFLIHNDYIIVFGGKAFMVSDLFIEEITTYEAIGAGEDFARAALYLGHSARESVEVACHLSCYVSEPIIEYKVTR